MSELSDKVDQAVLDALSDALPGPVTGLLGIVNYIDEEGGPSYAFFGMPDARLGESLGMSRALAIFYEDQFRQYLSDPD